MLVVMLYADGALDVVVLLTLMLLDPFLPDVVADNEDRCRR